MFAHITMQCRYSCLGQIFLVYHVIQLLRVADGVCVLLVHDAPSQCLQHSIRLNTSARVTGPLSQSRISFNMWTNSNIKMMHHYLEMFRSFGFWPLDSSFSVLSFLSSVLCFICIPKTYPAEMPVQLYTRQ